MRRYLRHDTDVPVEVRLSEATHQGRQHLRNVSRGGLSFTTVAEIPVGRPILIQIPVVQPIFEADGLVIWCRKSDEIPGGYAVGVRFSDPDPALDRQLVEQVCEIENHKRDVWLRDGRQITGEEAAIEWRERGAGRRGSSRSMGLAV